MTKLKNQKQMKQPNTECASCGKAIYKEPRRLERFNKHYCDSKCQGQEKFHWLAYIWAVKETLRPMQMANHIGIPYRTLRDWLREINFALPDSLKIRFKKGKVGVGRERSEPKPRKKKEPKIVKPKVENPVIEKKRTVTDYDRYQTHHPINLNKGIYIREHERQGQIHAIRRDSRTIVLARH